MKYLIASNEINLSVNKLTIIILLFSSCLSTECKVQNSTPDNLNFEKMTSILTDMYYMQAALETLPSSIKDSLVFKAKSEILIKYGISDSTYLSALAFYNANPKALSKLEKAVEENLRDNITADSILHEKSQTLKDSVLDKVH